MLNVLIEDLIYKNKLNNIINYNNTTLKIFGVFVSIERSKLHKLKEYPEDIHGCIGYWSDDYSKLNNIIIKEKILQVGNSAFYEDSRRLSFRKSAESDLFTKFKIYYMLLPLEKIDSVSGIMANSNKFDNMNYGLIAQSIDGNKKATYLPEVFKNMEWNDIKISLINKAGILNNNIVFYAYKTYIEETTLLLHLKTMITYFFNNYYNNFIPYEINTNIKIDITQDVRNIASMLDIYDIVNEDVKLKIWDNVKYYINEYNKDAIKMRQSSAFLLLLLNKLLKENINNADKQLIETMMINIKQNLYNQIDELESKFELGEVLMALSIIDKTNNKLDNQINKIINIIGNQKEVDDIFQYNWLCKFILEYDNYKKSYKLFELLMKKISIIMLYIDEKYETNYIAVLFECLSSLIFVGINNLLEIEYNKYINKIEQLILIIIQRKNKQYHLFEFINGNIRIDITGHILNGLNYMEQYYNKFIKLSKDKIYYKNLYVQSGGTINKYIYKTLKKIKLRCIGLNCI